MPAKTIEKLMERIEHKSMADNKKRELESNKYRKGMEKIAQHEIQIAALEKSALCLSLNKF